MHTQGNRIMDAILTYVGQEVQYKIGNPLGSRNDLQAEQLKTAFYKDLLKHFKKDLNPQERATRKYLKDELRRLDVKNNPGFANLLFKGRLSRLVRNLLTGNRTTINTQRAFVAQHQNRVGLEQNMARLTDAVKKAGFTSSIDHILEKMMQQGLPKFHIRYKDIRHPNTDFILHFSHIPGTGAYQFEKFDASARLDAKQMQEQAQSWQSFPVQPGTQVSASQAANLAEGRAICRDETNNLWSILDKTSLTGSLQTVQFNLEEKLKELPLHKKGMQDFNILVSALRSGATKEVVLNINGRQQTCQLVAAPLYQSVRILDSAGKVIDKESLLHKTEKQSAKLEKIMNKAETKVVEMDFTKGRRV